MNIKKLGKISGGQDGAIFNGYLFRFDSKGSCAVYKTKDISCDSLPISRFVLDKSEIIAPHSNSVMFGNAYYNEKDEFPLLYSNIYNNYSKNDNKMKGVTCVYRLQKSGNTFSTTLVQLIEIGFTEDSIWKSKSCDDVRPYGNFVIDSENSLYYAFTMRNEENCTRYLSFNLPKLSDGEYDKEFDVNRVILKTRDIKNRFDCEFHRYIQGACFHNGLIYSLEGFTDSEENPPAIRVIDVGEKAQKKMYLFSDYNLSIEPEMIDFENDICYYSDNHGNLYQLEI